VKHFKGFTLIEMLVTALLLSLIVLIGSSASGLFSSRWEGRVGKFEESFINIRNVMLVQEVLDSLMPYVTLGIDNNPNLYFEGNRNGFVAVSRKSIYVPGKPAVVRFSVVQTQNLDYDVVYEEWPMSEDVLRYSQQEIPFTAPIVLFQSVGQPLFEYFGWPSLESKNGVEGVNPPEPAEWLPSYNALGISLMPLQTRLRFRKGEGNVDIYGNVAAMKSGILSRYTGSKRKQRDALGIQINSLSDDCNC